MTDLIIDPEFRDLIPPLADEEFKQLEENVLRDGIQDPLKIWNKMLIDGHNRYELAKRHGLTFTTTEMQFDSRDDVKIWIIKNQLGRRNITAYTRGELVTQFKSIIATRAKKNQGTRNDLITAEESSTDNGINILANLPRSQSINTREELAKMADVSPRNMAKIEKLVEIATPEIKTALREGELSINTAYEGVKAGATTVEAVKEVKEKKPHVAFNSGNNEWYTPADIIEDARKVIGTITLDPASSEIANETVKATKFFTAEDDGLIQDWDGENIWLNPPYSSGLIEKFVDKLLASDYTQAIVLVNNATDTEWFSRLAEMAEAIVFPKGRVKFYKPDGTTGAPLQGQAILYFGDGADDFKKVFSKYGRCWQ